MFGAVNGKVIEPEFVANYGVEIILKSNYVNKNFLNVSFPPEFKDNIKLKGSFVKDGEKYVIPWKYTSFEMNEFGSVVVIGNDLQEIMDKALYIASKVEGYDVYYDENCFSKAMDVIEKTKSILNIEF